MKLTKEQIEIINKMDRDTKSKVIQLYKRLKLKNTFYKFLIDNKQKLG